MDHWLDDLARGLAAGTPRRTLLRLFGAAAFGAFAAQLDVLAAAAGATPPPSADSPSGATQDGRQLSRPQGNAGPKLVKCKTDGDCGFGGHCASGACVCDNPAAVSCGQDTCVNLQNNQRHCGRCNNTCRSESGAQAPCTGGVCECPIPPESTLCNGNLCVNTNTSFKHCGGCNTPCLLGQACVDGLCERCPPDKQICSRAINDGCIDIATDVRHCGGCGRACPKGARCSGGTCTCPPGQVVCELDDGFRRCMDIQTDNQNCGRCKRSCPPNEHCASGVCVCDDPAAVSCGQDTCVNLQNNQRHCGRCNNTCRSESGAQAPCTGGVCECPIPPESTLCNGNLCVNTNTSFKHCGKCNTPCPDDQPCIGGKCGCPEGRHPCGQDCCPQGATCQKHVCTCPKGKTLCGGACVQQCTAPRSLNTSTCQCDCPAGREACGSICCANGQTCTDGECGSGCPAGRSRCGSTCVDRSTDRRDCGSCGNICADSQICKSGACVCPTGFTWCANLELCLDLQTSQLACGGCDSTCSSSERCVNGHCESGFACNPQDRCGETECCDLTSACIGGVCQNCPGPIFGHRGCGSICCAQAGGPGGCCGAGTCCPADKVCVGVEGAVQCVPPCDVPQIYCSAANSCVNWLLNAQHCGGCNRSCIAGTSCVSGSCTA